ncbi:MAG: hypothetical protein RI973_493 [Bacteroidota bacterium]|jgi:hypothetical protein
MKNFFLQILLITGLGFLLQQFLPFWSLAAVAALGGWLFGRDKAAMSFAAGFTAAFLLWGGYAFLLNAGNDGILGARMGELFAIGTGGMLTLTALLGGLLGGAGALTGTLARKMLQA